MGKKKNKISKEDIKTLKGALGEDPIRKLHMTLAITSIIPFLTIYYLLYDELAQFEIFIGYHGLLLFLALLISFLGYLFTYGLTKNILFKIISFALKMKEDNELKLNLISSISHEVKNPLTSLVIGVQNMRDGILGAINNEQKEYLESSSNLLERMGRILTNVLYALKMETGKVEFEFSQNNIDGIISRAIKIYKPSFAKKNLDIEGLLNADCIINCDKDKILEVFDNLFSNISKYTPERGHITIRSRKENDKIIIECENSGDLISEESLIKIFDAFHRLDNSKEGAGLGLTITKQIVERHKGSIRAASRPQGGLKFTITLPL